MAGGFEMREIHFLGFRYRVRVDVGIKRTPKGRETDEIIRKMAFALQNS